MKTKIKIFFYKIFANWAFDNARETGGESSPYLEDYLYWNDKIKELEEL